MRRWLSLLILVLVFLGIFLWLPRILADRVYPLAYKDLIKKYALKFGIDPNLVAATIWTESRFDPYAVSPAGARGLMQLLPSTARSIAQKLGEGGLFSPDKLFVSSLLFAQIRRAVFGFNCLQWRVYAGGLLCGASFGSFP